MGGVGGEFLERGLAGGGPGRKVFLVLDLRRGCLGRLGCFGFGVEGCLALDLRRGCLGDLLSESRALLDPMVSMYLASCGDAVVLFEAVLQAWSSLCCRRSANISRASMDILTKGINFECFGKDRVGVGPRSSSINCEIVLLTGIQVGC